MLATATITGTSRAVFTSWLSSGSEACESTTTRMRGALHVGRVFGPRGQQRVVDPRGAAADDDRIDAAAKLVRDVARMLVGNPAATVGHRQFAVARRGPLGDDPRPAGREPLQDTAR